MAVASVQYKLFHELFLYVSLSIFFFSDYSDWKKYMCFENFHKLLLDWSLMLSVSAFCLSSPANVLIVPIYYMLQHIWNFTIILSSLVLYIFNKGFRYMPRAGSSPRITCSYHGIKKIVLMIFCLLWEISGRKCIKSYGILFDY